MVISYEKATVKIDSEHPVFLLYFIYELRSEHHVFLFMSGDRKQIILPEFVKKRWDES